MKTGWEERDWTAKLLGTRWLSANDSVIRICYGQLEITSIILIPVICVMPLKCVQTKRQRTFGNGIHIFFKTHNSSFVFIPQYLLVHVCILYL